MATSHHAQIEPEHTNCRGTMKKVGDRHSGGFASALARCFKLKVLEVGEQLFVIAKELNITYLVAGNGDVLEVELHSQIQGLCVAKVVDKLPEELLVTIVTSTEVKIHPHQVWRWRYERESPDQSFVSEPPQSRGIELHASVLVAVFELPAAVRHDKGGDRRASETSTRTVVPEEDRVEVQSGELRRGVEHALEVLHGDGAAVEPQRRQKRER